MELRPLQSIQSLGHTYNYVHIDSVWVLNLCLPCTDTPLRVLGVRLHRHLYVQIAVIVSQ